MLTKDRIKQLRQSKNLLQKEFAKKLDVSIPTVSAWEQGTRYPNSTQRKKICNLFNITEAEFFSGQAITSEIDSSVLEAIKDPQAVKTLLAVHNSSPHIKNSIVAIVEHIPELPAEKRQAIVTLCK